MRSDVTYKGHMIHGAVIVDVDGDANIVILSWSGASDFLDGSHGVLISPAVASHACPLYDRAPVVGIGKTTNAPSIAACTRVVDDVETHDVGVGSAKAIDFGNEEGVSLYEGERSLSFSKGEGCAKGQCRSK